MGAVQSNEHTVTIQRSEGLEKSVQCSLFCIPAVQCCEVQCSSMYWVQCNVWYIKVSESLKSVVHLISDVAKVFVALWDFLVENQII